MTVGHIYSIRNPEGREIYVVSTTKTDTLRWGQWKAAAKTGDWLACPMLRYAKERWGDLDACSYHVLTTVELPGDVAVAKQILRRLEAAFIESATMQTSIHCDTRAKWRVTYLHTHTLCTRLA